MTCNSSTVILEVLISSANLGQPKAAKGFLGGSLWSKEPPKDHLAFFGCSRFVMEFNTYNFTGDKSHMSLTSLFQGVPHAILLQQ